ncbi:MAG TPA: response regulator transcription factor [Verrucomicrobiae bacterium]|nr:response regulator transcription factor [Verrucomicrobiae bacterium]
MMPPDNGKQPPIRVSVVEDTAVYREHLVALINGAPGFACAGAHGSAESALSHVVRERPDVLLLDLGLPRRSGDECLRELKEKLPGLEVLVLTMHDEPKRIFKALEAGASGYLIKPVAPASLLEAISEVRQGGSPMSSPIARLVIRTFHQRGSNNAHLKSLTPREDEILKFLAQGLHTSEIAAALKISKRTVGSHLHHIYDKLHVASRSQAVAKFFGS